MKFSVKVRKTFENGETIIHQHSVVEDTEEPHAVLEALIGCVGSGTNIQHCLAAMIVEHSQLTEPALDRHQVDENLLKAAVEFLEKVPMWRDHFSLND